MACVTKRQADEQPARSGQRSACAVDSDPLRAIAVDSRGWATRCLGGSWYLESEWSASATNLEVAPHAAVEVAVKLPAIQRIKTDWQRAARTFAADTQYALPS